VFVGGTGTTTMRLRRETILPKVSFSPLPMKRKMPFRRGINVIHPGNIKRKKSCCTTASTSPPSLKGVLWRKMTSSSKIEMFPECS